MRGRDEETGEFHDKSRSQNRRDALDVLALGEKLVSLTPAQLARLPIPEDLLPHIAECKRITAHIAHKRQLAFPPSTCGAKKRPRWMRSATRWTPTARPAAAKWQ